MFRTEYVTNHKSKAIKAKRGLIGFAKVSLAWFILSGIINATVDISEALWAEDCMRKNPHELNQQACWATYRIVDGVTDLAGLILVSTIISRRLANDSKARYRRLEEET